MIENCKREVKSAGKAQTLHA